MTEVERMSKTWTTIVVLLVVATPASAATQTVTRCATASDGVLSLVRQMASSTDDASQRWRGISKLPSAAAQDVVAILDEGVCTAAAAAYDQWRGISQPTRRVQVVRVGIAYVVVDPNDAAGHFTMYTVFNSDFTAKIGGWTG
jgi:hypothetical protein